MNDIMNEQFKRSFNERDFVEEKIERIENFWKENDKVYHLDFDETDEEIIKRIDSLRERSDLIRRNIQLRKIDNVRFLNWENLDRTADWNKIKILQSDDNIVKTNFDFMKSKVTTDLTSWSVISNKNTDESRFITKQLNRVLKYIDESNESQKQIEQLVQEQQLSWLWCLRMLFSWWTIKESFIPSESFYLDIDAEDESWMQYFWISYWVPADELIQKFWEYEEEINEYTNWKLSTILNLEEWHTWYHLFILWKDKNILLSKTKNPFYRFDEEIEEQTDSFWNYKPVDHRFNYFRQPIMPIVLFTTDYDWALTWDAKTLIEDAKPAQYAYNSARDRIFEHLETEWKSSRIIRWMKIEEAAELLSRRIWEDLVVWRNTDIEIVRWTNIDWSVIEMLKMSKSQIEDIFWTHDSSRWVNKSWDSWVKVQILKSHSNTKTAIIERSIEQFRKKQTKMRLQLILSNFEIKDYTPIIWEEDAIKLVEYLRNNYSDWIEFQVTIWHDHSWDKLARNDFIRQLSTQYKIPLDVILRESTFIWTDESLLNRIIFWNTISFLFEVDPTFTWIWAMKNQMWLQEYIDNVIEWKLVHEYVIHSEKLKQIDLENSYNSMLMNKLQLEQMNSQIQQNQQMMWWIQWETREWTIEDEQISEEQWMNWEENIDQINEMNEMNQQY